MKHKLLSLLGILALTFAFFSCNPEVTTTYTVTYSSEYGTAPDAISVEENTTLSETQLPILYADNAVFDGWYDGETKAEAGVYQVKGTVTLTAHWVFSVTYSSEHGIVPEPITVEKNTILTEPQLPTLSDGTLVFKGWFDGETKAVAGEYHVAENVTLTARWAATATISYHSKFGTVPESFDVELNQTLTAENLAEVSCSPYTFLGWYYEKDDDNNGSGTQAQIGDKITADTPLYAKWKTATVSFSSAYGTVPSIKKYTGEKIAETEIPAVSEIGYTFGGWFNDSMQLSSDFTVTDDVIFDAKWIANTYKITFKANGGSGADYAQTVTYAATSTLNANAFTRDGYSFNGWNKAVNGSGTSYADRADFAVTEANDITLYAQWDPIADETTIVDMIKNMTESGTIAAKGAFSNDLIREINSALKTLPSNVYVFLDLSNVTGLTELENASTSSQSHSFYDCQRLSGIILPNGMTKIGDYAFYECRGLTSITIPDSVTKIGTSAFYGCSGLTSITIPDGVTSIGEWAFKVCRDLTSITIPDGVTVIRTHTFDDCYGLTSIKIPDSVTSIEEFAFQYCTGLTSITIPNSVTRLTGFNGCRKLTSIKIPDSVTKIGTSAFDGCTGLTSITIPDSVTEIECYAFRGCTGLTSITIPDSVTEIEAAAFRGCTGLTSITIPNSVTRLTGFDGCRKLTSIKIPDSVTKIGTSAFDGCSGLTSITIPDSVTEIEAAAFRGCTGLTSITIPDSVTKIGTSAFYGCSGLTSITIPNSVTSIRDSAFYDCSGLMSITIPDSVTKIGKSAFYGCSKLTEITFSDTEGIWYYTSAYNFINGTEIGQMGSDSSTNATLLTTTYKDYYLYKQ